MDTTNQSESKSLYNQLTKILVAVYWSICPWNQCATFI